MILIAHQHNAIMEENESQDHPESSVSTPNSNSAAPSGPKAPKDRTCPFCGQSFTSSSLGRHLDLYIRPKNPKPPDGVHNVHDIRKMRGSITRRLPRTSLKVAGNKDDAPRRDSSGWSSQAASKTGKAEARFTDGSPIESPTKEDGMHTWVINAPTWQATGVINDLPDRAPSRGQNDTPTGQPQRMQEMRRDTSGNRIQRPESVTEDMWKLQESAEVGRAAEMALREVFGSLEAAKKKAEPRKLFEDIEFCKLSFPGLCLAILPPPPALFSSTPFPFAHTWSLSPPGEKQFDAMNRRLTEEVAKVRNGNRDNMPESIVFRYYVHLQGAWEHWQCVSENDKAASWNLEISRAFVRESDARQELKNELEAAQQQIRHLEAEYDRMSRCQLPREYLLHPPNTVPVSSAVMREMKSTDVKSGGWETNYDADALINKWRSAAKATTRANKPPTQLQPIVEKSYSYVETERNPMKADMIINGSVFGINGPIPRDTNMTPHPPTSNRPTVTYETPQNPGTVISAEEEEAEGDADADGEAEDEPGTFGSYANRGALTKLRSANRSPFDSTMNGTSNANGKRPLAPGSTNGRAGGPKIYRERPKS